MNIFFSADIRLRAALILALFITFIWGILCVIVKIGLVSIFPYLVRIVFKGTYLLIETPVCWLHERVGLFFHKIDNGLAGGGNKIDTFLERWYTCWRKPKSYHFYIPILIYCLLLGWICIPYYPDESNVRFISGQEIYLKFENKLMYSLGINSSYEKQAEEIMIYDEIEQTEEDVKLDIAMKVITKKDPLSIRDIPSIENCEILERVERENTVFWKGDIAFGIGDKGGMEPWAKVETTDGTIGWARLIYLCPVNEEDFELELLIN